eukprot:575283-Pleurochrysis_carterae.AAC.3
MDRLVGSLDGNPRSLERESASIDMASLVASDATVISASQDDKATDGCFLETHEIAAWLYMKTKPEME